MTDLIALERHVIKLSPILKGLKIIDIYETWAGRLWKGMARWKNWKWAVIIGYDCPSCGYDASYNSSLYNFLDDISEEDMWNLECNDCKWERNSKFR
jgi:hypothetical protein